VIAADPVDLLSEAIALVKRRRGLDLSRYRHATLARRLANRILAAGAVSDDAYRRLLRDDPSEIDRLLATVTIKVSRFYRNAFVFDLLRTSILPELRAGAGREPLRLWSAGCANGEEPYTLALLAAAPATIHATDVDDTALAAARTGRYPPSALAELPDDLAGRLGSWTSADGGGVVVDARLRDRVRFARHDVASAGRPPGGPYHLICCRNVLIYLTPESQHTATRNLIDHLLPGGVLCLGEAEWPSRELLPGLEVIDRRAKLFRRKGAPV
jgi:chemotaxis methyl-accepting protein methylase